MKQRQEEELLKIRGNEEKRAKLFEEVKEPNFLH